MKLHSSPVGIKITLTEKKQNNYKRVIDDSRKRVSEICAFEFNIAKILDFFSVSTRTPLIYRKKK